MQPYNYSNSSMINCPKTKNSNNNYTREYYQLRPVTRNNKTDDTTGKLINDKDDDSYENSNYDIRQIRKRDFLNLKREDQLAQIFYFHNSEPFKRALNVNIRKQNRVMKYLRLNVNLPISSACYLVLSPYDVSNALYIRAATSPHSKSSVQDASSKLSDYYSAYKLRRCDFSVKNLSKETSTVDNKIVADVLVTEADTQINVWDTYLEECGLTNPSILDYDLFKPVIGTLINNRCSDLISLDTTTRVCDKPTVIYVSTTVGVPKAVYAGKLVNIYERPVVFYSSTTSNVTFQRYDSSGTLVNLTTAVVVAGINLVAVGAFSHINSVSASTNYSFTILETTDELQHQIVFKIAQPSSAATISVVMDLYYECEVQSNIKGELQYQLTNEDMEYEEIMDGLDDNYVRLDAGGLTMNAGTFSNAIKWFVNKIPLIGSHLSKGVDWLDSQDYLKPKAADLSDVWLFIDEEGDYDNPYFPYFGRMKVLYTNEATEGTIPAIVDGACPISILYDPELMLISYIDIPWFSKATPNMVRMGIRSYYKPPKKVKIMAADVEKPEEDDLNFIKPVAKPKESKYMTLKPITSEGKKKNRAGYLSRDDKNTVHEELVRQLVEEEIYPDLSADPDRLQVLQTRTCLGVTPGKGCQFFPVVVDNGSGGMAGLALALIKSDDPLKNAIYTDVDIAGHIVSFDKRLKLGEAIKLTLKLLFSLNPPKTLRSYITVKGQAKEYWMGPDKITVNKEIDGSSWHAAAIALLTSAPNFQYMTGGVQLIQDNIVPTVITDDYLKAKLRAFDPMPLIVMSSSLVTDVPYSLDFQFMLTATAASPIVCDSLFSFYVISRHPLLTKGYDNNTFRNLGLFDYNQHLSKQARKAWAANYLYSILHNNVNNASISPGILQAILEPFGVSDTKVIKGEIPFTLNKSIVKIPFSFNYSEAKLNSAPPDLLYKELVAGQKGITAEQAVLLRLPGSFTFTYGSYSTNVLNKKALNSMKDNFVPTKTQAGVQIMSDEDLYPIIATYFRDLGYMTVTDILKEEYWKEERSDYPADYDAAKMLDFITSIEKAPEGVKKKAISYQRYLTANICKDIRLSLSTAGLPLSIKTLSEYYSKKYSEKSMNLVFNNIVQDLFTKTSIQNAMKAIKDHHTKMSSRIYVDTSIKIEPSKEKDNTLRKGVVYAVPNSSDLVALNDKGELKFYYGDATGDEPTLPEEYVTKIAF